MDGEIAQSTGRRGSRLADDAPQQADDEFADAGEHLRPEALAHLHGVLVGRIRYRTLLVDALAVWLRRIFGRFHEPYP